MDFLKIVLVPYERQEFLLPKTYIQQYLPESVINQALMEEPTLEQLEIYQPVVTPEFMTFLVNLSQGIEPNKSDYKIYDVHKYLNTPSLLYYADRTYDQIPNRTNPNDSANVRAVSNWIRNKNILPIAYLLQKGYIPSEDDLKRAIRRHFDPIIEQILKKSELKFDPIGAAVTAASEGYDDLVRRLLEDPRGQQPRPFGANLSSAIAGGKIRMDILELMLADPRFKLNNMALTAAFDAKRPDIVARLLQDPRLQPNFDEVLRKVHGFYNMGDTERAKMFLPVILADPRFTQGQPQHYIDFLFELSKQLQTFAPRFDRR